MHINRSIFYRQKYAGSSKKRKYTSRNDEAGANPVASPRPPGSFIIAGQQVGLPPSGQLATGWDSAPTPTPSSPRFGPEDGGGAYAE